MNDTTDPIPAHLLVYSDSVFYVKEDVVDEWGIPASAIPLCSAPRANARDTQIVRRLEQIKTTIIWGNIVQALEDIDSVIREIKLPPERLEDTQ